MPAMPHSTVDQYLEAVRRRGPRPTPKHQIARTKIVADALWSATKARSKGAHRTRDGRRLEIVHEPTILRNPAGDEIGLELHVKLFDADGDEVRIDPVRRIINPPTELATPEGEPNKVDPVAAIWSVLWDCVDLDPAPDGWYA